MKYTKTAIDGVVILEPRIINDARGYFMETYQKDDFDKNVGHKVDFVQDNQSKSTFGVLRGLHFQKGEYSQAKLVRVLQGKVVDVAVDLRKSSATFGKYVMAELTDENQKQLFIPRGFAHGFQVLSETAVFAYKVDNVYNPQSEQSIAYNDKSLNIEWPILEPGRVNLSDKDLNKAVAFEKADCFE